MLNRIVGIYRIKLYMLQSFHQTDLSLTFLARSQPPNRGAPRKLCSDHHVSSHRSLFMKLRSAETLTTNKSVSGMSLTAIDQYNETLFSNSSILLTFVCKYIEMADKNIVIAQFQFHRKKYLPI